MLRFALEKPNIQIIYGFEVTKARKVNGSFLVENGEDTYSCDKLIIACGGLAGTKLGGSMSGYKLLGRFGHRSTKLRPALVQVKTDWSGVVGLKGVRANCLAQILHNGELFAQSSGELQFTEMGLSGPVMFEISRDVCQSPGAWVCRLDFLPHITDEMLDGELKRRRTTALSVDELLTGILHNRLGRVLTKAAGVRNGQNIADLTDGDIRDVCRMVKAFEVNLTEPLGMDSAQVTAGGVLTEGFDPKTMESNTVPGLYACGEVLDIDGDCGGYNLQWAWSSGRMAGMNAGKDAT
jgi:predicted Rossmann fold flavoprotein